jgi:hypothetical protein
MVGQAPRTEVLGYQRLSFQDTEALLKIDSRVTRLSFQPGPWSLLTTGY